MRRENAQWKRKIVYGARLLNARRDRFAIFRNSDVAPALEEVALMDFHPMNLSRGYAREDRPEDAASAR